ncbi:DNA-binding protein [Rhizobium sp. KAs_5_22]|uniref:helix-turn-helix domain-containing protein n=1 Tax=Ciceribacter selenitireducens TaxID=448181 RepID=UPI0004904BA4|nr:helix-turn-helix domain-containing protein [Ciceribacter selenitireducens]PPJ48952.1 DNA-binding protein [Rhizobium sp. KAs_5_22]
MQTAFSIPQLSSSSGGVPERLLTLKDAAEALNVFYWQIQRAVKRGDIPSYTPFNTRKLVKLSEVVAYIDSCRRGGIE